MKYIAICCVLLGFFVYVFSKGIKKHFQKIKKAFMRKKKADGMIFTMIIVFFIMIFSVTIGEYFRISMLQQDIEYQLQRSVNCAVEYAMGDEYRQDKITNLNVTEAKRQFLIYITEDTGLDSSYRKIKNGKMVYRLHLTNLSGASNPAVFTVRGYAEAKSLFAFLSGKMIKIPFNISSTNFRTD